MATAITPNARWDRTTTGLVAPLTWTAWVRPDELPADFAALFYTGGINYSNHLAVFIHQATSRISVWDDTFSNRAQTDVVSLGAWLFLGLTVSAGGGIGLYWRTETDQALSSAAGTLDGGALSDDILYLGSDRNVPDFLHTFHGAFAYARVFGSELTSTQVMAESLSPTAVAAVGAAGADWPLDNPAGSDESGNGNHLFLEQGSGVASITGGPTLDPFPALLPSQFTRPDYSIELFLGGEWVDVTGRLLSPAVAVTRGRADESAQTQPAQVELELDNNDGALTPDNPMSPWWPDIRRGVQCRIRMPDHEDPSRSVLNLVGGTPGAAQSLNVPEYAITGDIDVRWWGSGDFSGSPVLASKWQTSGDLRSWVLWVDSRRLPSFSWRSMGFTNGVWPQASPESGSASLPLPVGATDLAIRCTVEINAAPESFTGTWYTAPTIDGPWTQYGYPLTFVGPDVAIATTNARIRVGNISSAPGESFRPFVGQVKAFQLFDGIDGTVVANPDFRDKARDTTAFADGAGRSWTLTDDNAFFSIPARFWGEIADWSPSWPHGDISGPDDDGDARVVVTANGVLRRLSQGQKPLESTLRRHIGAPRLADRVIAWWPMEDGRDAETLASPVPGVPPMTFGGDLTLASDDSLAAAAPLPSIGSGQGAGWAGQIPAHPNPTSWRVDMFLRVPESTGDPGTLLAEIRSTGQVQLWRIYLGATTIRVRGWVGTIEGTHSFENSAVIDNDFFGNWGRISLNVFLSSAPAVNYSLTWIQIGGSAIGFTQAVLATVVGRATRIGALVSGPPEGISLGHVVYTRDTHAQWIASGFTGGPDRAFAGEGATARIARLCSEEQIPLAIRGNSNVPMGPQGQQTLLDLLQEAATADLGVLYERLDHPGLAYRARETLYDQTPALALDAGGGGGEWRPGDITHPFEPTLDDQSIRNDVTVTRDQGSSFRAADDDSILADGRYDEDVTVNVAHDAQLPGQTGWRLHLGTWPGMRYRDVSSELSVAQHLIGPWVGSDLGDRLTVDNLPPQHPTNTVDLLIQQTKETLYPDRWTIEATCTPAGPWDVGVIDAAGTPDLSGRRLDSATAELAGPVDETATEIDVAYTGTRWVSNDDPDGTGEGDYLPFDISVGGERMTVLSITGITSPQTFTVVRAVNQVSKPHIAGVSVRAADPLRIAL